jgi:hypothetical protein
MSISLVGLEMEDISAAGIEAIDRLGSGVHQERGRTASFALKTNFMTTQPLSSGPNGIRGFGRRGSVAGCGDGIDLSACSG